MRSRIWRTAAVAGAAALIVTGCSSNDDEPDADGSPSAATVPCEPDGTLAIGNVLPQTGGLSFLGPSQFAGSALAVKEINDAGGVFDQPVESFDGDSGDTTTNIAVSTTDEMLQRDVDVIVGTASADVTKTIVNKITDAGVLQISPATASTELVAYPDNGLSFRTAPPDQFQGAVLAEVARRDQVAKLGILEAQGSYGEGLGSAFSSSFESSGGTLAGDPVVYDGDADTFEAEVGQIKAMSPDAVVLIGYAEAAKIVQEMIKQGIGPDQVRLYLVDGNMSNSAYQSLTPGIMSGAQGTIPGAEPADSFRQQLLAIDPEIQDFSYGAEAYDAVNLVALSAVAAGSDCGRDIAAKMQDVSSGGTKCTSYSECRDLLAQGGDIDYDGQSGPVDFADNGDPSIAVMGVYVFGADGTYTPSQFVGPVDVPLPKS